MGFLGCSNIFKTSGVEFWIGGGCFGIPIFNWTFDIQSFATEIWKTCLDPKFPRAHILVGGRGLPTRRSPEPLVGSLAQAQLGGSRVPGPWGKALYLALAVATWAKHFSPCF